MKRLLKKSIAAIMALVLTIGAVSLAVPEYAAAAEDTIRVRLDFDCSSLGTKEALESIDFNADMPAIDVEINKGETVYDAILAAERKSDKILADKQSKHILSAYGLGNGLSGVAENMGLEQVPTQPFNYNWAGWMFFVDGKLSSEATSQYALNNDTSVDFRYMMAYKDVDGAYDWDFVNAYRAAEKALAEAKNVNRAQYNKQQLEYIDSFVEKTAAVKAEIDEESQGLWALYYLDKGTTLYGPDSPTDKLEKYSSNLHKAIEKKYYEVTEVQADIGDVYVGEKTKIDVKVLPEGVPQDCTYEVLFGPASVTEDGYVVGTGEGTFMIAVKSKTDPSKVKNVMAQVSPALTYSLRFMSDKEVIDTKEINLTDSEGKVVSDNDGKYLLSAGNYTYEIKVSGKEEKYGTLIVSRETLEPDKDNEINISWDESTEKNIYKNTTAYLNKKLAPDYEDWAFIGMARGDGVTEKQASEYYGRAARYIKSLENDRPYATDYAKTILGLTAAGWDVTNVEGYNLLEKLTDMNFVSKQGLNGIVYTLIAYDSHDYDIPDAAEGAVQTTREALVEKLLDGQKASGGWGWSSEPGEVDIDLTAMVLQALAPYYNLRNDVKSACDKAVDVLSEKQEADGTYISWDMKNASSIAEVIVALTALDIDPDNDARFVKNGSSLIDGLNSLAAKGGGYVYDKETADEFSTRSGYYAMTAYNRYLAGEKSLYDMSDVKIRENPVISGDTQNQGTTGQSSQPSRDLQAQTGDSFMMMLYITLAAAALLAIILLIATGKKKKKK